MIDIDNLRDTITTALADQLGTYTFSGGQTTPAIRVDDGSDPYDEEPSVEGLEVVLVTNPEVSISMLMGGYQQTFSALIVLKQWDIAETTLAAMTALMPYLNAEDNLQIGAVRRVVRTTKLDNIETMSIQVSQAFYVTSTFDD